MVWPFSRCLNIFCVEQCEHYTGCRRKMKKKELPIKRSHQKVKGHFHPFKGLQTIIISKACLGSSVFRSLKKKHDIFCAPWC